MYPGSFFVPNYSVATPYQFMKPGVFSRLASTIKSVNWSGLLNGADRTLGLVNQTIPLVREAKPMFSNMKSMIKLAKAFRKETNSQNNNYVNTTQKNNLSNNNNSSIKFFI